MTDIIIDQALASNFKDFEDATQYYCALHQNCDVLITRNESDFSESDMPVLSPDEYLNDFKEN